MSYKRPNFRHPASATNAIGFHKKDYEGALAAFKKAISKKADYNEAYYQAGWCLNHLENYESAVELLKKYIHSYEKNKKKKYNDLFF